MFNNISKLQSTGTQILGIVGMFVENIHLYTACVNIIL
jgi:preprotein translocase subunit Sss1